MGRFTVTTTGKESHSQLSSDSESDENPVAKPKHIQPIKVATHKRKSILRKASFRRGDHSEEISDEGDRRKTLYPETAHRLEDLARQGMTGSSTILPGMKLKRSNSDSLTASSSRTSLTALGEDTSRGDVRESKRVWFSNDSQGLSDGSEVPDNKDVGFEFPLPLVLNSDWPLDENLPLISQDSSSCSGTVTSSLVDPTELPEDLCEELKNCSGTSLIKGRFSVNKPKGDVPSSLANLFNNQPSSGPLDATDVPHSSNSSQGQSDSVPSSLRNLFTPRENSDNNGHLPRIVSSSVKTPSCSSPSSSQCPDFSFPVSRIHSTPTSPKQERKRESLRKLSGQPSSSFEDAESLTSRRSPDYTVRKKSTSLRLAANGNSGTVLRSSSPQSDKKMARFAIEPPAHSQEASSSTEPLACESSGVLKATGEKMDDLDSAAEKKDRSKLVSSRNARVSAMGKLSVA